MTDVSVILKELIGDEFLCKNSKIFYNEAQVQFRLAWLISKISGVEPTLEHCVSGADEREYLDIWFEHNGVKYGIELKYKTCQVEGSDYTNQGAQNNGKYHFIRDVLRLENFKRSGVVDVGYAILMTNDKSYWTAARPNKRVAAFDLTPERGIGIKYAAPQWQVKNGTSIVLGQKYSVNWQVHPNNSNGFRALLIKV